MNSYLLPASPVLKLKLHRNAVKSPFWGANHQGTKLIRLSYRTKSRILSCNSQWRRQQEEKPPLVVSKASQIKEIKNKSKSKRKGTIGGAVALIIGTSIGSGILALPNKAYPAGLFPSSVTMILCWFFLLIEALLLVEINVKLLRKKKSRQDSEFEVMSIRTMAQETLGQWGGALVTVAYVFLGYTSMIAYTSKSGEILIHFFDLPQSVLGFLFTTFFSVLISVGGTRGTDQVNQWLTASMIGLLVAIEGVAIVYGGGWSGFGGGDWGKVPATIPVLIFSLVYHDLAPFLCAYLDGDLRKLRISVVLGSFIPLMTLLVWDAIILALSKPTNELLDPLELLTRVEWKGVPYMVEAFSLLAVGTSVIGTLLGFSEFFKEQLNNLPMTQAFQKDKQIAKTFETNNIGVISMAMVVIPSLFISTTVPDAFSIATDIAGGYCMTILYGVVPPAMAWAMQSKESDQSSFLKAKPALLCVGLFAFGIVIDQFFQDFMSLQ